MQIDYPESWAAVSNSSPEAFEADARMALAVKLFERGRLTSGQSAQLAGGALEHERQAAMDCFADPDTARRIAEFSQGKRP